MGMCHSETASIYFSITDLGTNYNHNYIFTFQWSSVADNTIMQITDARAKFNTNKCNVPHMHDPAPSPSRYTFTLDQAYHSVKSSRLYWEYNFKQVNQKGVIHHVSKKPIIAKSDEQFYFFLTKIHTPCHHHYNVISATDQLLGRANKSRVSQLPTCKLLKKT